jgi:outer membrane protein OmpA-like peptidoglycan-associated protein
MFRYILLLVIFYNVSGCLAQKELSSSDPKAIRLFKEGARYYDARDTSKALELFGEAIKSDPKFIEAYMLKANVYEDMGQHENAVEYYKKAIEVNPEFFPKVYYSLANEEYYLGRYTDAKTHIEKFLSYPNGKGNLHWKAKKLKENVEFAMMAVSNPVPFDPVNMGDSINSTEDEYFPSVTVDGQTFIYTREIRYTDSRGKAASQEDLYKSKKNGVSWNKSRPISEINTHGNEGASSISSDGQYIFFTACEQIGGDDGRKTKGSCDIFLSKKVGEKFNEPRDLDEPLNSTDWDTQPSFSSDGRTLYFVRRIPVSYGVSHSDILVSSIGDDYRWSQPVSVSDLINTPSDESFVFIHPDDQTLYFASSGHPGMGGSDIFFSRRDSTGKWGRPENIGYPINSINDEISFRVSPDGKTAYFSSNRPGGKGGLDIYQFPLYEKARPRPVSYMKGKVYDAETKKFLSAAFELIDLATGKVIVSSSSNVGNGEFLVALPTGKSYALNVSKDGFLFYSDNFKMENPKSADEPFLKDVPLNPIKAGESIVLNNIFYDTDKYALKSESKVELGKLILFLNKNPKIKFEISGHTDNVGTKQYNQTLSEKRAKSVYDYLIANGIPANRMTSKGYGDTKPVADNSTDAGKAKNRRTEFLITAVE